MTFIADVLPALVAAGSAGAAGAGGALSTIGSIASIGSGVLGALGSIAGGNANAKAAEYQARVAENNAQIARQNQEWAERSAITNEAAQGIKSRASLGAVKAAQGASGVDVNSGSALDVRSSAAELGQLDAINIRANAARDAYGYATQASGYDASAGMSRAAGANASSAGMIGAASSLLGGATSAVKNYALWSSAGGGQQADWISNTLLAPGQRYGTAII